MFLQAPEDLPEPPLAKLTGIVLLMQLNGVRLRPKQEHATGRWQLGGVQLPPHTQLLVDETVLQSGRLDEHGINNLRVRLAKHWCKGCPDRSCRYSFRKAAGSGKSCLLPFCLAWLGARQTAAGWSGLSVAFGHVCTAGTCAPMIVLLWHLSEKGELDIGLLLLDAGVLMQVTSVHRVLSVSLVCTSQVCHSAAVLKQTRICGAGAEGRAGQPAGGLRLRLLPAAYACRPAEHCAVCIHVPAQGLFGHQGTLATSARPRSSPALGFTNTVCLLPDWCLPGFT